MYTVLVNVSYDDKGYIYLIKNTEGKKKDKNISQYYNGLFLFECILKCNLFLWNKTEFFSSHYSNTTSYFQFADLVLNKHFIIIITFENMIHFFFDELKVQKSSIYCSNVEGLYCHVLIECIFAE